jgi:EmrB/QacA subfamily drug resistance transporter
LSKTESTERQQTAAADRTASRDGGTAPQPGQRHRWLVLGIVLVGSFMAVLDTTIVTVALPSIAKGIHARSADLEWIVSGYALTFGLVLVPAGRLGDRFGNKPLFLAGLTVFTLASLGCGLSSSPLELDAARFVQGLGAGIYYPAISATIQRTFGGRDRSRAFGYLGGVVGISTAVGPLLGGALIQMIGPADGWRWVFLVNVVIGGAELPVALRLLPRRQHTEVHVLDPAGSALLAVTLLLFLFPMIEGREAGWPPWSWACLGGCAIAGATLAYWELRCDRRGGEPVLQPSLLRHRSFAAGLLLALLYFGGFASLFFTLSILWQQGLGRGPLATGLLIVPFALGSLLSASNSYRFSNRFGRTTVLAGIAAMFAGQGVLLLVLHATAPSPSAWLLAGPLVLAGLGNGLVIAPNQDFVLGLVPRREAGTAGGMLNTAQRVGAAVGIVAIGTALFGSGSGGSSAGVDPRLVHTAQAATIVELGFLVAAFLCGLALPRALDRAEENR